MKLVLSLFCAAKKVTKKAAELVPSLAASSDSFSLNGQCCCAATVAVVLRNVQTHLELLGSSGKRSGSVEAN
jgi:hypothetical protein